ncbi:hypothetical protein KEM48_012116 [Puccinia striiformis f. sp. tritici PST-130]|nr:hypothetical protein KEM48_012116 [Puccinia striiformis f. sp. tritici PST-130]
MVHGPAAGGKYGPPLDYRSLNRAKTDWLMWAAGASVSNVTRGMFIDGLSAYIRHTDNKVFGDLISLDGGCYRIGSRWLARRRAAIRHSIRSVVAGYADDDEDEDWLVAGPRPVPELYFKHSRLDLP